MYKRILSTGLLVLAAVVLLLGLVACDETAAANEYSQSLNNSEEQPLAPKLTTSAEEMPSGDKIPSGEEMSPGEGYGKGERGQDRAQNNAGESEATQQNEEQSPGWMGTGRTSEIGQADLTYGQGSSQGGSRGQGKDQGTCGGRGNSGGQGSR